MRDPLHFLSVKHKLALLFAGLCLLSYGVGGGLVWWSARHALETEIRSRIDDRAVAVRRALDEELELLARRAADFASDGYVRERTERLTGTAAAPETESARAELERHLRENKQPLVSTFIGLCVEDAAGHPLAASGERDPLCGRWPADPSGAVQHSDLLLAPEGEGPPRQLLATPIRSLGDTRIVGRLVAVIDTEGWIRAALGRLTEGPARVGQGPSWMLSIEDRGGLALRADWLASSSEDLGEIGVVRLAAAPPDPQGLIVRSDRISQNGWTVQVRCRPLEAFSPVSGLQSRILAVGLVLAVLSVVLLWFPMRFLIQPLGRLRDAVRRMREGDYSVRVAIDASDEVGELARAFDHMAESVEGQTRRLRESAHELRHREAELRQERDRLDGVIRSLRDGLVLIDGEGHAVLANAAAEPVMSALERQDDRLISHYACSDSDAHPNCASCVVRIDAPARTCVLDVGDRVFEVHGASLPPGPDGRRGRVLVARDITSRIARDEKEIHQERLSVLGEVAAVMAHELNNPLTSIRMFAQMLADRLPGDSPYREHVEVILRNADSCRHSIQELLGFAASASPETADVDVHAVVDDVSRFLRPLAERAHATVKLELGAADDIVSGDEIQLRQVFVNLIVNAVQAGDRKGTLVTVRTRESEGWLEIDVLDTGPGVPPASCERIFDPFFSTKPRGKGTGLGLPTARRIVELHAGRLTLVSSRPGCSIFRVRLPLRAAGHAQAPRVAGALGAQ